jgi:putative SOS response-associated peptidase YedK
LDDLKALLSPYPADNMETWPVSQRVSNFRNNDADLPTPLEVDAEEFG